MGARERDSQASLEGMTDLTLVIMCSEPQLLAYKTRPTTVANLESGRKEETQSQVALSTGPGIQEGL